MVININCIVTKELWLHQDAQHLTSHILPENKQRGMCIKSLIWPPLEPKIKNGISPISSDWSIRRITEV